ncbi:hypothetical protein OHA98_19275 [Streptomyces sp. NBC_00654]|uniref:hypothetical protein n=1 Tax=Streptomyces sp. NBC_00654 TaxID=2975799 RepID=UPI0022534D25|nr:hypothetical protein [Streptomyces sp. NBC_00654]MCX4966933.1 hypothetical protein [Streptomyces sp. NBC_00654]
MPEDICAVDELIGRANDRQGPDRRSVMWAVSPAVKRSACRTWNGRLIHRWPHPSPTPPQASPGFAYGSDIASIGLTNPVMAIAAV